MKDSQPIGEGSGGNSKYIKESNERFSTYKGAGGTPLVSISRRVMKDSQQHEDGTFGELKYIKESNERFSTHTSGLHLAV